MCSSKSRHLRTGPNSFLDTRFVFCFIAFRLFYLGFELGLDNLNSDYCGLVFITTAEIIFYRVLPDEIWIMMADIKILQDPIFTFPSRPSFNLVVFLRLHQFTGLIIFRVNFVEHCQVYLVPVTGLHLSALAGHSTAGV